MSVQTVTQASRSAASSAMVRVETAEYIDPSRPAGRRFGALVHALLASVSFDATLEVIRATATTHGKLVDATEQEVDAATVAVITALKHAVMAGAAASAGNGRVRRETPVMLRRSDGTLVEGVIDLTFRETTADFDGWTVVDFKIDREFESSQSQYSAQVGLYVEAIEKATNLPARGVLLVV
jgi:ATP-dependent helicase/nuclease subunit A